jgi:cytidylate kinase
VVEIQSFAPILGVTDVPFASMSGGDDLPARVTVSGHPGSGTSTLVAGLCKQLNWEMLNGGQVFRNTAAEKGMTLEAFGQYCIDDDSVDKELDQMLTDAMLSENSPQIVESRLAGWWAFKHQLNCPRIWIEVSEEVRANRVVNREGGNEEEQLALIRERMEYDGARYKQLYDIDIESKEPYTCIIDSDTLNAEQVLSAALEHLEAHS